MRSRIFSFIVVLCGVSSSAAHANWEYSGGYNNYTDSGSRATISLRGGASLAFSKVKNEVGSIIYSYCVDTETGEIFPTDATGGCGGYGNADFAGTGSLG